MPWIDHQSEFVKFCIAYDQHSDLKEFCRYLEMLEFEFIDRFDGFAGNCAAGLQQEATAIDVVREKVQRRLAGLLCLWRQRQRSADAEAQRTAY